MGTIIFIMLKNTHLDFLFSIMHVFLYSNMLPLASSFWDFLSKFIAFVFGSILGCFFRSSSNEYFAENDSGDSSDSNIDELKERQSSDHVDQSNIEVDNSSSVVSSSKYEVLYGNGFSEFIEEPNAESYTVHEFFMASNDLANCNDKILVSSDFAEDTIEVETEDVNEEKTEDSVMIFTAEKIINERETEEADEEKTEESALRFFFDRDYEKYIKQEVVEEITKDSVDKLVEKQKHGIGEIEKEYIFEEKTGEPVENYIIENRLEEQASNMQGKVNHVEEKFVNFTESPAIDMYLEKWHLECNSYKNFSDSDEEFIELEPMSEKLCVMREDLRFEDEEAESLVFEEEEEDDDDDDDSEFMSDDDELLEQLKMEMKLARTGGLPTILEESFEPPKMVEQLGPLNMDEKYDYKYHIAEIQKVYKTYSDKMKKLDILSSQTMHAISLLQLKDPVRVSSAFGNSSAPAIKWPFKQRKPEADPVMKLLTDLHMDFETVYVGQICLSWEILHWQYVKLKGLSECDSFGTRQYNQVAGEFQRFQVLVQRFLEDEPFQNRPRVENYTKNRYAVRQLLQVPLIKDDCSRYKLEDAVLNEMLADSIEESMHIFWEFLRVDKDDANVTSKTPQQAKVVPHDPIDLELLMDVRTDLQKKEKRFKEIQRSTNCIIKKFQRQHEGNLLDYTLLMAQVELKLVSRVLNMLKISTDQLVWCHEKLQRINFRSRKIEIEPSFTLFPC